MTEQQKQRIVELAREAEAARFNAKMIPAGNALVRSWAKSRAERCSAEAFRIAQEAR